MTPLLLAVVLAVIPPTPTIPAQRLDVAMLEANQDPIAPSWSRCPELFGVALANWPDATDVWATLDHIFWREARCNPNAINRRSRATGLMQITRGNLRRLGVPYTDALDPATNIAAGYQLYLEHGWRPWHTKGWKP